MSNDWYTNTASLVAGTRARADDVETKFDAVETSFDKFPGETDLLQGKISYGTSTGSANVYILSLDNVASYTDGLVITFKANHANTGAANINVSSLGVKSLRRQSGEALAAGDIPENKIVSFRYNSTSGYFEMTSFATGDMSDITTVAGISANVTTVAGISADVTTVAAADSEVTAIGADLNGTDTIGTVAANLNGTDTIGTVAGISADVTTVAGASSDVTTVATDLDLVTSKVETVATNLNGTDTIGTVASIDSNVTTVAGVSADVTSVAGISANVTTVAGISANVTTVAGVSSDVTTVATDLNGTDTIGTVATDLAGDDDIGTVATNISAVQDAADNLILETAEKTADYTLADGDQGKIVSMNKSSAATVTIPTNASVAFDTGTIIGVYNQASDEVTIAGAGGVTVRNAGETIPQYGEVSLRKRATDEWVVVGLPI